MAYRKLLPPREGTRRGTVYLLHFDRPFGHARHYIGFTSAADPDARLRDQLRGSGANLVAKALAAGVVVSVARQWGDVLQTEEYRLKNRGGAARLCPVCRGAGRPEGSAPAPASILGTVPANGAPVSRPPAPGADGS